MTKKENLKSNLDYAHSENRQLSQTVLKDSSLNYIKAIYDCPSVECRLISESFDKDISFSAIIVNEESVPVNTTIYKVEKRVLKKYFSY